ncbi:hypothetical protein VTN00DRAFT_10087 [Thermoascus crustaceus]|uniref:uncharacterized protein n=1 Tax=Thermoascus crustaceus TaxID=5088 RepID=UPI0037429F48
MDTHLLSALDSVEDKLSALLTSLTTSPTAANAPAATIALLDADDALTSALETLRIHQANYAKILRLRAEGDRLEDRVKGIVRDIEGCGKEISTVCGNEDEDDSDTDEEEEYDSAVEAGEEEEGLRPCRRKKEVDYKLLLDFARRISKYNQQAAADAAAGAPPVRKKLQEEKKDAEAAADVMNGGGAERAEGVASVTREATSWLDESANMTREMYMIPYPTEDRIRLGLMGQIQLAAAEGGIDPEKEVERLIREAEGPGTTDDDAIIEGGDERHFAGEAAKAAAHAGSAAADRAAGVSRAAAPAPKPKTTLDLDLYDPDDDDI